jgi:hypothetical protein
MKESSIIPVLPASVGAVVHIAALQNVGALFAGSSSSAS